MAIATEELRSEILKLKSERKAVILAHNYQRPDVQDIADFVGDSLMLSQEAARTDAEVIVFCGVHFMAETAAILCPDKTVLLPDKDAGCSLAAMISAESLRKWKAQHPGAVVVMYINSSAEVKAESDYICTSSNAAKVVLAVPPNREILFGPDQFLGAWVKASTGRPNLHIWPGYCHVHNEIDTSDVRRLKAEHPQAEFVMHPECGCLTHCMPLADKVVSTEGIVRHCTASGRREFIIGTETGILHRLRRNNPDKKFYPVTEEATCGFMKMITLEKVLWSLEDLQFVVKVPPEIARRAKTAIDRMLQLA